MFVGTCKGLRIVGFAVVVSFFVVGSSATLLEAAEAETSSPQPGDVNLTASRVYIFVDKKGLGHQHAIEGRLKAGSIRLGAAADAGQLTFDMQSFDADTLTARKYLGLEGATGESTRSQVNDNMKGREVLDVKRYPIATFDIQSALPLGMNSKRELPIYRLIGTFTLHGTSQPVSIDADVAQARGWLSIRGNFSIKQTAFGITPYSKAFGTIGVADSIQIHGDLYVAPSVEVDVSAIPERR